MSLYAKSMTLLALLLGLYTATVTFMDGPSRELPRCPVMSGFCNEPSVP